MRWPVIEFFKLRPVQLPPATPRLVATAKPPLLHRIADDFLLDPREWEDSGERDAILASSGMGKSYLAGVMMEEVLETGGQVFIIDPEGENHTLTARYPMLVVGGPHHTVDLDIDTASREDFEFLVETVIAAGASVLFDLSEQRLKQQQTSYIHIVRSLFEVQGGIPIRRPVKLMVEEAQLFAPQKASNLAEIDGETSLMVSEDVAKRGRKRGINPCFASQRPAAVNKDVLSQCNRFWFGGTQIIQDCAAMKPFLNNAGIDEDQIRLLKAGDFYFYSEGKTIRFRSRKRYCEHGGSTPKSEPENQKPTSRAQVKRLTETLNAGASATAEQFDLL